MSIRRALELLRAFSWRAVSPLCLTAVAVVLPKCPLCIVAYLTALGFGATFARGLAPWLLPAVWCLAAVTTATVLLRRARPRASAAAAPPAAGERCCGG